MPILRVWGESIGEASFFGTPAGGDLDGKFPSPVVVGLQGFPISSTPPILGDHLTFNGTEWEPTSTVPGIVEVPVTNNTGSLIARGSVLTIEPTSSTDYDVMLLDNSNLERLKILGIAKADIPDASPGLMVALGSVSVLVAGGDVIERGNFVRAAPVMGIADGVAGQESNDTDGVFGLILETTSDPGGGSTALVPCHVGIPTAR